MMGIKQRIKKVIKSAVLLCKEKQVVPIPQPVDTNELLKGKVALVTGGTGGIGSAIAKAFANSGCKVIVGGTNEQRLRDVSRSMGGYVKPLSIDVTDIPSLPDKISEAAALFEEGRIDILVNAAGVIDHADFLHMTEKEYDRVMAVNAKGTFFMGQAMGSYMIENKIKGHVLNFSSSSALRPASSPYRMSKWAVRGLTLGMAEELLPYGITVNAIAPGPVATGMLKDEDDDNLYLTQQPMGRYAAPSEIANLAVFMVSGMGDLIVGDTFYITGGSGTISLQY